MLTRRAVLAAPLLLAAPALAASQRLTVVTSFTILADMARNVAGDRADVASITRPGAEIHGYEPVPRDLVRAQDAGLILWNGLGLERWFAQFLRALRGVPEAVLTRDIQPILFPGTDLPNPHAWMGLDTGTRYIAAIEAALSATDPANAAAYRANAAAYAARVSATLAPIRDAVRALPPERRWLVTSEGAFSYLCRDFHLRELYLWPFNADRQGTPQQVRHVVDTMRENRIGVIFSESTISDRPARAIAAEVGARYAGALHVDTLSDADGPVPTYLDLMRVTATTILEGLSA